MLTSAVDVKVLTSCQSFDVDGTNVKTASLPVSRLANLDEETIRASLPPYAIQGEEGE